jgi:predicted PurR-regulated permease PerM
VEEKALISEENKEKPPKATITVSRRVEIYLQIIAATNAIIVMAIFCLLIYFIRGALLVFGIAFVGAYILGPAVEFFGRWGMNRLLVLTILYTLFVALVVVGLLLLLPIVLDELRELQTNIRDGLADPESEKYISERLEAIKSRLAEIIPGLENVDVGSQLDVDEVASGAASWILSYVGQLLRTITNFSGRIIWLIALIILIPFITFFLIKDGRDIKMKATKVIPDGHAESFLAMWNKIDKQIGKYIRGRLAESLIISFVSIVGLRIIGIRYYLIIGGIAGFANLVPYIGPVALAIPPIILAAFQYGIARMLITGAFVGAVQLIDNTFVIPLVVGRSIDLHPVLTVFVVFIGGQLLGILGMMLAMPVTSILIVIYKAIYEEFKGSIKPV